jgi:hypothetical protein
MSAKAIIPKALGYILYRGPSRIDGTPIVVVANKIPSKSGKGSKNSKTGAMVQTWIIADENLKPQLAAESGSDYGICGNCPHRYKTDAKGKKHRTCYVTLIHGPRAVYEALQRNRYLDVSDLDYSDLFAGHVVRLGSYGDPAAAPVSVWRKYTAKAKAWTGYTHQWRNSKAYQPYVMASVDSEKEATQATKKGWRYFRVGTVDQRAGKNEVLCPASEEAGKKTTCENCKLCQGTSSKSRKSIMIPAHGPAKAFVTIQ